MNVRRWIPGMVCLALAIAAVAGLFLTRDRPAPADETPSGAGAPGGPPAPHHLRQVDTRPLLTARHLLALAVAPEEQELAHQALKLAEHAVDLTFADALRQAADEIPEQTPEMKARLDAKQKAQAAVEADDARIKALTDQLATARPDAQPGLQDQVDVVRAQRELDQDELDMATESLERNGGDPQAEVKRLKALHDAAQQDLRPAAPPAAAAATSATASTVERFLAYSALRDKRALLAAAERDAKDRVQRQTKRRATIVQRIQDAAEARQAAEKLAAGFAQRTGTASTASREQARAAVERLMQFRDDQQRVTTLGRRIQDHEALAEVYERWGALVDGYARTALHHLLAALLAIALVLVLAFLATRLVDRLYEGVSREQLRAGTLRTVVKFAVQLVGALLVLFIVIGVPGQATTVLGLAGAGLTVAMKDFIVAFFGWFVLMSKHGIRVGDWVEIEGVGGEVVEIGLFHTVLMEMGAWIDAGHPTGRRVSFVNSFAIEGHYFNFSTSGQWMWDDLRLLVPLGQDPYPILDRVEKLVAEETAANAKLAEQEWRASSRYRVKSFSAVPGFTVVPTASGVEIHVRYITRAPERYEARRRLYQEVVALLHGKGASAA
ncbi:MAG TPA: mechanosensitive ion channel domain-containing protein [Anaeromyxobacteraceae bacterium]|nr:mechanosensitive ion channel domain-containing protein [Anaeromyxobacteraceae bacterium]